MKLTIEYSYDPSYVYSYHATAAYDGRFLIGVSDKSFEDAGQDLLKIIAEIKTQAVGVQPPKPKEIEL